MFGLLLYWTKGILFLFFGQIFDFVEKRECARLNIYRQRKDFKTILCYAYSIWSFLEGIIYILFNAFN